MLQESVMTQQDFYAYAALPENANRRLEWIHGEMIDVTAAPSPLHNYVIVRLVQALQNYLDQNDIGFVFSDSVSYPIFDEAVVIPDVSFISYARQRELPHRFEQAPDLAVEVVSPSNSPYEMLSKVELYLRAGTQRVWMIDPAPQQRVARVYRLGEGDSVVYHKLTTADSFDGETLLPGFTLPLARLFPPTPDAS